MLTLDREHYVSIVTRAAEDTLPPEAAVSVIGAAKVTPLAGIASYVSCPLTQGGVTDIEAMVTTHGRACGVPYGRDESNMLGGFTLRYDRAMSAALGLDTAPYMARKIVRVLG